MVRGAVLVTKAVSRRSTREISASSCTTHWGVDRRGGFNR